MNPIGNSSSANTIRTSPTAATNTANSSVVFKLPSKPTSQSQNNNNQSINTNNNNHHNNSPSSINKSIAFLQPMTAPGQGTILSLDTMLAKISEDQANKAKLILSDLGAKRRSRQQRKPVMVVNSGHSPRSMFPKINIINAINTTSNNNSANNTNPNNNLDSSTANNNNTDPSLCQNIVFSGSLIKF